LIIISVIVGYYSLPFSFLNQTNLKTIWE
jgi:hypothetical protein